MEDHTAPLERVALLALSIGRRLLEWGANARTIHAAISNAARGFGCDAVEVYCQHAAVMVMLRRKGEACMQMGKAGEHGMNLRRAEMLLQTVDDVGLGKLDCESARREIHSIPERAGSYPVWFTCLATGVACAAFGRLLGTEWISLTPICLGAAIGQWLRHTMFQRQLNIFLTITCVGFVSALMAGLGSRLLGAGHLESAMAASVLLLVPGPAILNAQMDAIDGRPNLAAARSFRILYIIIFMTLGLLLAQQIVRL